MKIFRAAAIVLASAMAAFAQVASNTAALRAARIIPGLPVPPAATHWLTPSPIVIDVVRTQEIALVTASIVSSQEMLRVVFHKNGAWKTQDVALNLSVTFVISTNVFAITNAPEVVAHK